MSSYRFRVQAVLLWGFRLEVQGRTAGNLLYVATLRAYPATKVSPAPLPEHAELLARAARHAL